uniref:Uncharacterized protein n=1 Tax=Leersia perrieri TaxID=77586 RepID=A0A0D9W7H6_9ORYZ
MSDSPGLSPDPNKHSAPRLRGGRLLFAHHSLARARTAVLANTPSSSPALDPLLTPHIVVVTIAMRDTGAALLPVAVPLLVPVLLLLLASELATLGCSHRMARADVAAWKHHALVAPSTTSSATTTAFPTVAGTGDAAAALGESKRLVPQGSNPLHN